MRSTLIRLAAVTAGVVLVASCDTRLPTSTSPGGPGTNTKGVNANKPTITIDTPTVGTLINAGDSIFVSMHLHDAKSALTTASLVGMTEAGATNLGTFTATPRYKPITIPLSGKFRPGLRDTVIRRYLLPVDTTNLAVDSLVIIATATDSLGNADTVSVRVNLVTGPKVTIVSPTSGDSVPAGVGLSVGARAQQIAGVASISIRVQGEANWPTKLDTTIVQTYNTAPQDITFSTVARIPADAPVGGRVTVTASALDVGANPGSAAPVVVFVRSVNTAQPRVTQSVPPRAEFNDSVNVKATGDGIAIVGLIIRDSLGAIIQTDSVKFTAPFNGNVQQNVSLNLPPTRQGQKLGVTAFAIDQLGRIGYAVPITIGTPQGNLASALVDSTRIVFGHTFPLPRQGVIGDIAVDAVHGNVFLSNTAFNNLEVFQNPTGSFAPGGIAVGSLPWGMFVSNNPDTLFVANSGGTNISRVFIGSASAAALHEDLANRILTRNTFIYQITETRDASTGKIRLTAAGPISYSDRPQYIVQSAAGRIFYSTRPTASAPAGTIRWLDPKLPVPDPRQVWQYGNRVGGTTLSWALFNADSVAVGQAAANSPASDTLFLWDHPYGQRSGTIFVADTFPTNAVSTAIAGGSDAELISDLDVGSLALSDTTFVAASGDRKWVAFGEGHTAVGRVMMVKDSAGVVPGFFSPNVTVTDLTDNASESVFGVALDLHGSTVASHGAQAYFAFVDDPFHLRLQGKYDSFDDGAGIAFHPSADGVLTPMANRLAFVASASGKIEIVDIAYYINRGTIQLKNPIYGPLRVSLPMPGDAPNVILKLFTMSPAGLTVVNLTAADILPGPP
jgi:hypothetical protein